MSANYINYQVEIKDSEFTAENGPGTAQTAIVTFYGSDGAEIGSKVFGTLYASDIYDMIRAGKDISLDNMLIRDFSTSEFRRIYGLDKKEPVIFRNFSARNAFFESATYVDFSYSRFTGGDINFEGTNFAKGEVLFSGSDFENGNVIFSNTLFHNGNISFSGCTVGNGNFLFKNAVIHDGRKDFQDIVFGDGEISFVNTEFNWGEILFINSKFGNGKFSFKVSRISGGKVDFHYSVFGNGEVSFERAEFGNSRVDFRAVDFGSGRVNFNRAIFGNGEINFEGSSCNSGKIQFRKGEMGYGIKNFSQMEMENSELVFDRTFFGGGDVLFRKSRFKNLSLKGCHLNQYFDLRLAYSQFLDLSDTVVRDIIDLKPYDFKVDIKTIDISGMRLIGKLYIDWELNECCKWIESQKGSDLRRKAEQFRILKENFSEIGKYVDEDNAYVIFKRYEARADLYDKLSRKKWSAIWLYPSYSFRWLVYDKIGLYATSPGRVLISVIGIWFTFGFIYFLISLTGTGKTVSSVGNPDNLTVFIQSFYHSAITFFTIGYGDVYPVGLSRIFSGIEGFIGVFMMSYFTVAFVRRILR